AHRERQCTCRIKRQNIADASEGNQAIDLMVTIGAAADNAEGQVDFGGRLFDARDRHDQPPPGFLCSASAPDEVSSGGPDFSCASMLISSSGWGLRSRAWDP